MGMLSKTLALVAVPWLVPWLALAAQDAPPDSTVHGHVLPAIGVHIGEPQKASLTLGVLLGEEWQSNGHERSRKVALLGEAGLGAGGASVAYLRHGYGSFGEGWGLSAKILRTWKDPWGARPNVTYAGGELILWPLLFVGPRVGVFHRIGGDPTENRWLISFDFGFGP